MNRRQFLTLPFALLLAPLVRGAEAQLRKAAYDADVGLLYQTLSLELTGTLDETVDRASGRYEMKAVGQGARISNRIESSGMRRQGRWSPLQAVSCFRLVRSEARAEYTYYYAQGIVEDHYQCSTIF